MNKEKKEELYNTMKKDIISGEFTKEYLDYLEMVTKANQLIIKTAKRIFTELEAN